MKNVEINGEYVTRSGRKVVIHRVMNNNENSEFVVFGMIKESEDGPWFSEMWTRNGIANTVSINDLRPSYKCDDLQIDDKVAVWDDKETEFVLGHFAGFGNIGYPMIWAEGKTSFTTKVKMTYYNCAKYSDWLEYEKPYSL